MIQRSNLSKCGLLSNISLPCGPHTSFIGVAALGFQWYRSSHPKQALNYRYDLIIGPILLPTQVFFYVGKQKIIRWCQPVQSHSHAQQPLQPQNCVREHCPGETGLSSSAFQAILNCLYTGWPKKKGTACFRS